MSLDADPNLTNIILTYLDEQVDPDLTHLAAEISEITIETSITAASTLTIQIIDPYWAFQKSGALDVDDDGLLPRIELNFPLGSRSYWRLAMVQGTTDTNGPNLTLTFVDQIVAFLRDFWGPKTIRPGSTTRAQFVKQLVDEVNGPNKGKYALIQLVIPSLNVLQPVEPPSLI